MCHSLDTTENCLIEEIANRFYKGQLELEQDNIKISTNGIVELVWLRNPRVKFSFTHFYSSSESAILLKPDLAFLTLPNFANKIQARILQYSDSQDLKERKLFCSGEITEPIHSGMGTDLSYVILHLPNFHETFGEGICNTTNKISWAGRFFLYSDDWAITIDKVENFKDLYKELKGSGGYALTHTIKIQREDRNTFNIKDIETLLENLFYFLSFARGYWIESVLEVGFDINENRIWEKWTHPRTDRWQNVSSWFNPYQPEMLTYFWSDFCKSINDKTWGEILRRAIVWCISANQKAGEIEGSIILAQTAHEMLSWTKFVSEKGLSHDGYKNLHASDKLRLILSESKIPLDIPNTLKFLSSLGKSKNWDGSQAITEIRNKLVHPSPKNIQELQKINNDEMQDAYILTMWYLELTLLYLLGYKDEYVNRLIYMQPRGQTEPVPWI